MVEGSPEVITSTSESVLTRLEADASFFERQLRGRSQDGKTMSTTTILATIMTLLIRALIATAKELRRANDREANKAKQSKSSKA